MSPEGGVKQFHRRLTKLTKRLAFSIDVTKTNKDLQAAKRLNDQSAGKILELTRRFSISPLNVQTTQIAVDMKCELIAP